MMSLYIWVENTKRILRLMLKWERTGKALMSITGGAWIFQSLTGATSASIIKAALEGNEGTRGKVCKANLR